MSNETEIKYSETMAFVVGHTGEVGKELLKVLQRENLFKSIVLIGRRKVDLPEPYQNLEQRVVDFDNLKASDFADCKVGFCCLGTTRGKSGADGFYKVDHDYVVSTAKSSLEAGCQHFNLVSSKGADKNSWFFYLKTKGQTEDDISSLGFSRTSIFRPATLLCDRPERRPLEKVAVAALKPVSMAFPTWMTIPTQTVAEAMVANLKRQCSANEVFENAHIHKMGQQE